MMLRKFSRTELESEPHDVLFKDLYPWDAIEDTPFGSSLAIVQPGGRTMLHSHAPAETFVIVRGNGTISVDGERASVSTGDVIYLPPQCVHDLQNDSQTEELAFVSVFWTSRATTRAAAPRLVVPSPKTPNGPLHLGHLAGPYLLADAMRRYYRMLGTDARLVALTDDHQSYVAYRAASEGGSIADVAARFCDEIAATLADFDARPDITISPARDPDYRAAVTARFTRLLEEGKLEAREVSALYCERCARTLHDVYVHGTCPHCRAPTSGAFCESCSSPCAPAELVDARCSVCDQAPIPRVERRLVFRITPYTSALADYHRRSQLSPKLRRLATQWLERDFAPVASEAGTWGIPVPAPGFEGQVICPWFEVSLAASYIRDHYGPGTDVSCFFGYDNAFLYLVQDPAVSLALDPSATLPVDLAANEFLLRDAEKMSTSRARALDARAVLSRVPADLLRLYLAKVRPEDEPATVNVDLAQMYLVTVTGYWQRWLSRVGQAIARETGGVAPAPSNPSLAPWSHEQRQFLEVLTAIVARARRGFEAHALREVVNAAHELVERATSFSAAQAHLAGVATLVSQRATGLALELAAARALAMILAPIMPSFAARLWSCLGESEPIAWSDTIAMPASRTITLANETLFPASIELAGEKGG